MASPNPRGTRCHWKTPDPPLRHSPAEFQAKGSGWGASPRHSATSQAPVLQPYGALVSLGAASGAWGILRRAAWGSRSHPDPPGDSEMRGSAAPGGGFWGRSRRDGSSKGGPCAPNPRRDPAAVVTAAGQAQRHGCALARTQWPGPPGRETNFRSAPEGLFWTLCSA